MLRPILLYGLMLAAGAACLQWLDLQLLARTAGETVYAGLLAAEFLTLGLWLGFQLFGARRRREDGNPKALESLGISGRELDVLKQIAAGRSTKEIARVLEVSPNTVKSHIGRLYAKLNARRRTDAVNTARQLGILP